MFVYYEEHLTWEHKICIFQKPKCFYCVLSLQGESGSVSIQEALQKIVDDKAESDQPTSLSEVFQKSEAYSALRKSVLDYLKYNRYHLTMYARPGLL